MSLRDAKYQKSVLERLFAPHASAVVTTPRQYTGPELLQATRISARQLHHYVSKGAVAPPVGNTRAAKYSETHREQIERVKRALAHGATVAEVAEAHAAWGSTAARRKSPPSRKAVEQQTVHHLTDRIHVVAAEQLSAVERAVLIRVLKAGALTLKEKTFRFSEKMNPPQEAKGQLVRSGRRVKSS